MSTLKSNVIQLQVLHFLQSDYMYSDTTQICMPKQEIPSKWFADSLHHLFMV